MPIQISSFLLPKIGNTWFLLEDIYVKGGYQSRASVAARDLIELGNRKPGMLVHTLLEGTTWILGADGVTWTPTLTEGPAGLAGPAGPSLSISMSGTFAARTTQDSAPQGFVYLATDTNTLYVKASSTVGDWSAGVPFGVGVQGPVGPQGVQGPVGTIGPQGVAGAVGAVGAQGVQGLKGDLGNAGPTGPQGLIGPVGATIRTGTAAPTAALGLDGDYYIETPSNGLYLKSAGAYALVGTLKGDQGLTGFAGSVWRSGVGVPSNTVGIDTDFYLDASSGNLYKRGAGVYSLVMLLKGGTGATGPQGPTGPSGAVAHAASHASGGSDQLTAASIGALAIAGGEITGSLSVTGSALSNNQFANIAAFPSPASRGGTTIYSAAEAAVYYSNGTQWLKIAKVVLAVLPYDVSFFVPGTMAVPAELVGSFLATRKISFIAGLTGSIARAKSPPTASVVYDLRMGGVSVGSVTFAPGASNGTFGFLAPINVLVGESIELICPTPVSTSIADVTITLVGQAEAPQGIMG